MRENKKEEIVHNQMIVSIKNKRAKRNTKEDKEAAADISLISQFKYYFNPFN